MQNKLGIASVTQQPVPAQAQGWKQAVRDGVGDVAELLQLLGLSNQARTLTIDQNSPFATKVPRNFVARMRYGDPNDPLLQQVLARTQENETVSGYVADPVGDLTRLAAPGVVHKYADRVLLITTGACAVHCRYCFRRHFPYDQEVAAKDNWSVAVRYIRERPQIREIILSGGDPLSLDTAKLQRLTDQLKDIEHIQRFRIHSRQPIVLPERIDDALLTWIKALPWPVVVVLHSNHANEIDQAVVDMAKRLRNVGATLLNQAVLLRSINDDVTVLEHLSGQLFAAGILPYYLNMLDQVQGAQHFYVPKDEAIALVRQLRHRLSGYLVPRLVREEAGKAHKIPLDDEPK
jgi:L-lysine 2,3-aminomutase